MSRSRTSAGPGSSKGRTTWDASFIAGFMSLISRPARARANWSGGSPTPNLAVGRNRASIDLGAVTRAGAHIEHPHPGTQSGEFKKRQRIATLIGPRSASLRSGVARSAA